MPTPQNRPPSEPIPHGEPGFANPRDLRPFPSNVRQHTPDQIKRLVKSIENFGFTAPVLVDEEGTILAGHGRVQAALELELKVIPTVTIAGLTTAQKKAYVLADNKLTDTSFFALPELKAELLDLDTGEIDLTLTGFSQAELADLLGRGGGGGAEKPPEEERELPVARRGDVWRLGSNYLVVGTEDSDTILEDADKVLKSWQKLSKSKAALHSADSGIARTIEAST